jgi:DNA-binding Lrp family transcriptional regulator
MSARQISDEMGCHKKTVESLVKKLLESDSIDRVNVRSDSKPLWVYSLKKGESG